MLKKEREDVLSDLHKHIDERDTLKAKVCALEEELQNSSKKIKSLSEQANLKMELAHISGPLMSINALLQRYGIAAPSPQNNTYRHRFDADLERRRLEKVPAYKTSKIWKIALILFALASILLLVVLFFQIKLYSKYNNSYVEEPKVELKTDVEPTNAIESKEEQALPVIEDYDGARIGIKGYSGKGRLQYGKEYVLFLSNRDSQPIEGTDGIIWDCDGGIIDNLGGSHAHLKIKRDSGSVRIVCHLPNGQQLERELEIQSLVVSDILDKRSEPYYVPDNKKEKGIHHVSKLKDSGKYKSER